MALRMSDAEFRRQYAAAVKRGVERERTEPKAIVASYDRKQNEITIRLANGAHFTFPCDLLSEFRGASADDIAAVEIRPHGTALHWERLDQDFTVGGLIASVFADKVLMAEMGRRGGRVQSTAKAIAARENGQKGGRPKTNYFNVQTSPRSDTILVSRSNVARTSLAEPALKERRARTKIIRDWFEEIVLTHADLSAAVTGVGIQIVGQVGGAIQSVDKQNLLVVGGKEGKNNEELALAA